jgi:ABC-2 type transport system permease protein
MKNLIQNELIKWFRRPSFYVMSAILVLLSIVGIVFTIMMGSMLDEARNQGGAQQLGWRESLEQENEYLQMTIQEGSGATEHLERQLAINEHRLENDLEPSTGNSVWTYMDENLGLTSLITLFVVIIAGGMIASEFTWGTIKLLMIRPISRSKILVAKYLSVLVFMAIFMAILFVTSFVTGAIAFGFDSDPSLLYLGGKVYEVHPIFYVFLKLCLHGLGIIMFATIAFMISSVFRNNSLAIGISLFLLFTGTQITTLVGMKFEAAKFSPFANIHFQTFLDGMPVVSGVTFWFSVGMFLVYFVLLHVVSFLTFVKRDIAA